MTPLDSAVINHLCHVRISGHAAQEQPHPCQYHFSTFWHLFPSDSQAQEISYCPSVIQILPGRHSAPTFPFPKVFQVKEKKKKMLLFFFNLEGISQMLRGSECIKL